MKGTFDLLARLTKLFARYAQRHMRLTQSDGPVRMHVAGGRRIVEITSDAAQAEVRFGPLIRQARRGKDGKTLRAEMPYAANSPGAVVLQAGKETVTRPLAPFATWKPLVARVLLIPPFLWAGVRAVPGAVRWFRDRDPAARIAVRNLFGLAPSTTALEIPLPVWGAQPTGKGHITIVMPVFNALEMMQEALARVEAHTDLPWRLIVIEDASTDAAVRPWLRDWAKTLTDVTLLENDTNLGFIGSVNRGLDAALPHGDPVVLLNTDAFVPKGWASRLIAPLADARVASVTPLSNDAELMSVPMIAQRSDLKPGQGDAIDAAIAGLALPEAEADLPTGVGFCLALSPDWLARVGTFDTGFGRGYGEEVDWCQRALAMGARHVGQTALFVEHRGGTSFGSEEKRRLIAQNSAVLSQRYPQFDQDVQDYISNDPLLGARIAHALARLGAGAAHTLVYLAHDMGGGAEADLQRRIAGHGDAVVLRVGGAYRWQIEVHGPGGVLRGGTEDQDLITRYLGLLPRREIIYSCAVGDPDPISLPPLMMDWAAGQGLRVLVHDYFPVSPAYTLLDDRGAFRGVPGPAQAGRVDRARRPDGSRVPLADWQAAWGALLARADVVEVFSEASADILRQVWPDLGHVVVRPHALVTAVPRVTPPQGDPVVGVLGNMNAHKGAQVLVDLSRAMARGQLVLLGQMAPGWTAGRGLIEHGAYAVEDIPALVARYGITRWFIPSVWPETFSFTTHEALATGLPVYAYDLGAQAAAVRASGQGGVIDPRTDIDSLRLRLLERHETAAKGDL